jgi:hypothetical protein
MKKCKISKIIFFIIYFPAIAYAWTAPIGIPSPTWPSAGIDQARPNLPGTWTSETAGWYFISDTSGCSDSRAYGYPGAPRCSLPSSPSAGSKVILNGPYDSFERIDWIGSNGNEIWIMGYDTDIKPVIGSYWEFPGSYIIIDSLSWSYNVRDGNDLYGDHILIRNCEYENSYDVSNSAAFGIGGAYIIYYDNVVSKNGNWQYTGSSDIDRQGIKVYASASDVWIVDSTFYHCHGDGVAVGDANNEVSEINRIYVGRNIAYENYQYGFWTKNATDVIYSQNVSYSHKTSSVSGNGGGMGGQYDGKYIWFLYNKIYTCNNGIFIASSYNGGGGPWYAIGNVIYDIENDNDCTAWNSGALHYRNDGGFTAAHNTIYNADIFYTTTAYASGTVNIRNNIFSTQQGSCRALYIENETPTLDYNLYRSNSMSVHYNGSNYSTIGTFASGESEEINRQVGDPLFVNPSSDLSLQNGSPSIDNSRTTLESAYTTFQTRYSLDIKVDFDGNARPAIAGDWDIGAYEFGAVPPESSAPAAPQNLRIVQ